MKSGKVPLERLLLDYYGKTGKGMLPERFTQRMKNMLGAEYEEFQAALEKEEYHALRINPLKADAAQVLKSLPFALRPIPWAEGGFYYEKDEQPGKHPFHDAGVYYIQEPSAQSAVIALDPGSGERVLDLCAAPGGKSTQIAARMAGRGILVCNEIHPARARILSENVERLGVRNAVVTNETPDRLAVRFPGFFDRILVDAPCSGEGMFRKNDAACEEWSPQNVERCAERQDLILRAAHAMLRPGGTLCYSTCTFAPAENEGSVSRFLHVCPDMRVKKMPCPEGFAPGRPEWVEDPAEGVEHTFRLWPHKVEGEGHFVAVLQKEGGFLRDGSTELENPGSVLPEKSPAIQPEEGRTAGSLSKGSQPARRRDKKNGSRLREEGFRAFAEQYLLFTPSGSTIRFGDQIYLPPAGLPSLEGLRVLRPGLHLGTEKKGRFEPAHALALAIRPSDARYVYNIPAEDPRIRAWLNGESLPAEGEKGWYLICVDGFGIGWGKQAGGILKNHYPKGLRRLI